LRDVRPLIVAVSGATGYIASHIAALLLRRGFQVRGTAAQLKALLPDIQLMEADLLVEGSFDAAVRGAHVVFHTACPVLQNTSEPSSDRVERDRLELLRPAVDGTLNVLRSIDRAGASVARVVLTSSMGAVVSHKLLQQRPAHIFSDRDWDHSATLEHEPYRYAKTIAELSALQYSIGKTWRLVAMCPAFTIGPPLLSACDAPSVKLVQSWLDGSVQVGVGGRFAFGAVDVRDVAAAHVAAAEHADPAHRYLISSPKGVPWIQLVDVLRKQSKFTIRGPLPQKEHPVTEFIPLIDSQSTLKDLSIELTPLEKAITDMADAILAHLVTKS
jgi:nucleoside-diphosphate-sugar epimerase